MRVFIAIEFTQDLKSYLQEISRQVSASSIKGNFTHRENFHLTVKFLGEINREKLEPIKQAINLTCSQVDPVKIALDKLGFFPRKEKKIIWLGLKGETKGLNRIVDVLDRYLAEAGYPKEERPYTPHITLGREIVLRETMENLLKNISIELKEMMVDKISLMESGRIQGKLVYSCLYSCRILK